MALLFRQLYDMDSGTFTYLLADDRSLSAVIIDPVFEQHERDLALIDELGLTLEFSIETHCHADHVTAAYLLRQRTGCKTAASAAAGIEGLDITLAAGEAVQFGGQTLEVLATPGHTDGCISLLHRNAGKVFTGDALLIRGCGRTDFQQGSAARLFESITRELFTLPDSTEVYPGHDYVGRSSSSIGEERRLNPRIGGGANLTDFVSYLDNMRLPHPRKIDIAVPANVHLGKPDHLPQQPGWAPVTRTYAGVLEVPAQWVAAHLDEVHVLDVRTAVETDEEPQRVPGAILIPLNELRDRLSDVPTVRPITTICRSGRRSVLAADILRQSGWDQVANIKGGLLSWYREGLPLEPNAQPR
jgi:sulfur dioxygenase